MPPVPLGTVDGRPALSCCAGCAAGVVDRGGGVAADRAVGEVGDGGLEVAG